MAQDTLQALKDRLAEIDNLRRVAAVLEWDQSTYMPAGGAAQRGAQLAAVIGAAHRLFVDEETKRLLDAAVDTATEIDAALVRVARRDYEKETRLPASFIAEEALAFARGYETWVAARANDDFAAFAPALEANVALARRRADYLGYESDPYDALLDLYDQGMTTARLDVIFSELRDGMKPLIKAIAAGADAIDASVLHRSYDESTQLDLSKKMARSLGYDFNRGRLDLTIHPFETSFGVDDVRITTRVSSDFLQMALMGTIHETGHALYEQNIDPEFAGSPLAFGASYGLHESQSRLWENVVGRSKGFWTWADPLVRAAFPEQLADVSPEVLYRAFNKVAPSLIRVEADEATYNLHIMLRYELERDLLNGRLAVRDLPGVWKAKMQESLGVTPPTDAEGVLQDVHWAAGMFGSFPSYTLGNVLSVQLYDAALRAHPDLPREFERGKFSTLLDWLRANVYRYGHMYEPDDLVTKATGHPIETSPYLRYLQTKFGALYGLDTTAS